MGDDAPLVFESAVEGLYLRALKGRLTDGLRDALKAQGLDVGKILPAYPLATWEQALRLTAAEVFPDRTQPEAMRELGRLLITGYQHTAIGLAMFPLMRLLGPARMLARMGRNFQTGTNYVRTQVTSTGPTSADLWFNRVIQSSFYQGILEAGLEASGAKGIEVRIGERTGDGGITFEIRWS